MEPMDDNVAADLTKLDIIGVTDSKGSRTMYLCTDGDNFYLIESNSPEYDAILNRKNLEAEKVKTIMASKALECNDWPDPTKEIEA